MNQPTDQTALVTDIPKDGAPGRPVMPDASRDYWVGEIANGMIIKSGAPAPGGESNWAAEIFRLANALMDQRAIVEVEEGATAAVQQSKAQVAQRKPVIQPGQNIWNVPK